MTHRISFIIFIILLISGVILVSLQPRPVQAQPRITNTTISVIIPTTAPTEPPQANNPVAEVSPSPTFTPTQPLPNARLISIAPAGTALIRDIPETGAVLGVLQNDVEYQVLGQYFSWYQIQLDTAPNGIAWVYFEDIQVSGNLEEIPAVDPNAQPAELSEQDIATQTAQALFQTPGFAETSTAESRLLEIPQETRVSENVDSPFSPTFTPPADIVQLRPTVVPNAQPTIISDTPLLDTTLDAIAQGDIPPVLPIIGLTIVGILGLLIASIRN